MLSIYITQFSLHYSWIGCILWHMSSAYQYCYMDALSVKYIEVMYHQHGLSGRSVAGLTPCQSLFLIKSKRELAPVPSS